MSLKNIHIYTNLPISIRKYKNVFRNTDEKNQRTNKPNQNQETKQNKIKSVVKVGIYRVVYFNGTKYNKRSPVRLQKSVPQKLDDKIGQSRSNNPEPSRHFKIHDTIPGTSVFIFSTQD